MAIAEWGLLSFRHLVYRRDQSAGCLAASLQNRIPPPMTNRLALTIFALIVVAVLADQALNGGAAGVFLMRKFIDMVEYLSFWR